MAWQLNFAQLNGPSAHGKLGRGAYTSTGCAL